jgi:predicted CXXCH cytochrome family protein
MKYLLVFFSLGLFIVLPLFSIEAAAEGECLNVGCHAKMLEVKYVHGPVAVGDCGYCHTQTGKHSFRLSADGAGLCGICHDIKVKSNCGSCHDPHGSAREFQLKPGVSGKCKK